MSKPELLNIKVERVIDASPEVVYDLVADVTRIGEWSPECTSAEWIKGATEAAVGAQFKGNNKLGFVKWSTKPEITEADRGRTFAFKVPGKFGPQWRYEFEATEQGGTRVVQSVVQQGTTPAYIRFLQRRNGVTDRNAHLAEGMATTLDGMARTAVATANQSLTA